MIDMLMQLGGIFTGAFVIGLSGAMMPGPLLAVTIQESARRGMKAGPMIVLGHAALEAVLVAAVTLGMAGFLQRPHLIGGISLAGAGVLGWLGIDMIRSARRLSLDLQAKESRRGLHPVVAGIVVSLSNPYWTLWWVTIGIAYILVSLSLGLAGVLAFFAGHILSDLAWYTGVSWAVARGRRFMTDPVYRGTMVASGAVLIVFCLWFFGTGLVKSGLL